jgi:precorrin-6x reductase
MTKILIIGGTAEAKNLHYRLQEEKLFTILSYAGLTESIDKEVKNIRVGALAERRECLRLLKMKV